MFLGGFSIVATIFKTHVTKKVRILHRLHNSRSTLILKFQNKVPVHQSNIHFILGLTGEKSNIFPIFGYKGCNVIIFIGKCQYWKEIVFDGPTWLWILSNILPNRWKVVIMKFRIYFRSRLNEDQKLDIFVTGTASVEIFWTIFFY